MQGQGRLLQGGPQDGLEQLGLLRGRISLDMFWATRNGSGCRAQLDCSA